MSGLDIQLEQSENDSIIFFLFDFISSNLVLTGF